MISKIIAPLINVLISLIPEYIIRDELINFLNNIEKRIKESPSELDDVILLPLLDLLRKNLSLKK